MEGHHLHPTRDGRGVLRFDAAEVEGVAKQMAEMGSVRKLHSEDRKDHDRSAPWNKWSDVDAREEKILELQRQLSAAKREADDAVQRLAQYQRDSEREFRSFMRELERFAPGLEERLTTFVVKRR